MSESRIEVAHISLVCCSLGRCRSNVFCETRDKIVLCRLNLWIDRIRRSSDEHLAYKGLISLGKGPNTVFHGGIRLASVRFGVDVLTMKGAN